MIGLQDPASPIIVRIVEPDTDPTGIGAVLLQALGFTGIVAVLTVIVGALVAGLLVWNLQLRGEQSNQVVETFALQPQGGASVCGELIYIPDRQIGVLRTASLPPLLPGQVYQMWLIKDGRPVGAGVFTASAGDVAIDLDRTQYQAFALTREPGPIGSSAPTSDPFAIAPLAES